MGKRLASAIASSYPELQQMRTFSFNLFPPGPLVTYSDQQHQRFIYILVTKRFFSINLTMEHLNSASKR